MDLFLQRSSHPLYKHLYQKASFLSHHTQCLHTLGSICTVNNQAWSPKGFPADLNQGQQNMEQTELLWSVQQCWKHQQTTLNTNVFHPGNAVYITIRWLEWPPVNKHKHHLHPENKSHLLLRGDRALAQNNLHAATFWEWLWDNHNSKIISRSLFTYTTGITTAWNLNDQLSPNLNINFIGKSVQCRLLH